MNKKIMQIISLCATVLLMFFVIFVCLLMKITLLIAMLASFLLTCGVWFIVGFVWLSIDLLID